MALLGSQASIKVAGTAVALTDEPAALVSGLEYQITDEAKRALDPATAVTIKVGGSTTSITTVLDYAHGVVTFASAPGAVVTISGAYLPLLSVAEARAFDTDVGYETADASHFGDTADRLLPTRAKCSLTLEHLHARADDFDPGSGTWKLSGKLGSAVFVEIDEGAEKLRGWFLLQSQKTAVKLADAIGKTVTAQGVRQTCSGRSEQALFSWR